MSHDHRRHRPARGHLGRGPSPTTSSTCSAARRPCSGTSTPSAEGFWAVTRYDDVRAVSRDHQTFSAELGSTFVAGPDEEALEMIRMTILNMDPPKHSRYRRLVSAGFTPRMINQLVDHIDEKAEGIVADIEGRDEIEFVEEVAAELPLQVICEMIGVPNEDRHLVFDWSNRLVGFQDEDFRTSEEDGQIAAAEIYAYCEAIAADRREQPRDDIMTALVQAEVDGDRLAPGRDQHVLRDPRRRRQRDHPQPDRPLDAGRCSSTPR